MATTSRKPRTNPQRTTVRTASGATVSIWADPQVRFNSGYWDGIHEAHSQNGRRHLNRPNALGWVLPDWDAEYCAGYEAGIKAGAPVPVYPPESSTAAWDKWIGSGMATKAATVAAAKASRGGAK